MELAGGARETGAALSPAFSDWRGTQYRHQERCEWSRWRRLGRISEGEEVVGLGLCMGTGRLFGGDWHGWKGVSVWIWVGA